MKREDVLMEALPYIRKFHGRTMVIKLGGHAMVEGEILCRQPATAILAAEPVAKKDVKTGECRPA